MSEREEPEAKELGILDSPSHSWGGRGGVGGGWKGQRLGQTQEWVRVGLSWLEDGRHHKHEGHTSEPLICPIWMEKSRPSLEPCTGRTRGTKGQMEGQIGAVRVTTGESPVLGGH